MKIRSKQDAYDTIDELYMLYYKKGDIIKGVEDEHEASIILSAAREMLFWDHDGEELYEIKLRMIIDDLKEVIPPKKYPEYWL